MVRIILWALVAWVAIGVVKGSIDLGSADVDSIVDALLTVFNGIADVTIKLIPKGIDLVTGVIDQIPDNGGQNAVPQ